MTSFEGDPAKPRVALWQFDSVDQINAWRNSAAYMRSRAIGDKYAKFRSFAIEGVPQ